MADPMRSIRVSDDLWKQAKVDAAQQGIALQDWLAIAIIRLLDNSRKEIRDEVPGQVPAEVVK